MMRLFRILSAYLTIGYQVYGKNKKLSNRLFNDLERELKLGANALSEEDKKRMFYYTIQCSIVASWASRLRGSKLNDKEILSVVQLGALTPLIDDLTDDFKMDSQAIFNSLERPLNGDSIHKKVAQYLYSQLAKRHGKSFVEQFRKVLKAQDASLRQLVKDPLSREEIIRITKDKGAMSILLYRGIIDSTLKEGEKEAFMSMGYATQLINDQFDVYKDYKNGVQSTYTIAKTLAEEEQEFLRQIDDLIARFKGLDYPPKNIQKCLLEISCILARGMVCLDQLKSLEKKSRGVFKIDTYSRKDLICDMEKPENIVKSIQYSLKLDRDIGYEEITGLPE